MGRIHPAENKLTCKDCSHSSTWTVWKKSSMAFQGTDGFSVYDSEGKLAFRVDNYSRKHKELLLMDGAGKVILALRPQILSMYDQWNGFKCEDETSNTRYKSQVFSMRRRSLILQNNDDVEIFINKSTNSLMSDFRVEGSFWRRSCNIKSYTGEVAAQISRKKANKSSVLLSDDVFSLEISTGFDEEMVMAFVVVLDRICYKPYLPFLCS